MMYIVFVVIGCLAVVVSSVMTASLSVLFIRGCIWLALMRHTPFRVAKVLPMTTVHVRYHNHIGRIIRQNDQSVSLIFNRYGSESFRLNEVAIYNNTFRRLIDAERAMA